jgi:hypothetical protein
MSDLTKDKEPMPENKITGESEFEVEELDDKDLEDASGGTVISPSHPDGVQCHC